MTIIGADMAGFDNLLFEKDQARLGQPSEFFFGVQMKRKSCAGKLLMFCTNRWKSAWPSPFKCPDTKTPLPLAVARNWPQAASAAKPHVKARV